MSDNPTQETPDSRSFEERVFARFDNLDGRLTALEDKVDSRLRETRPIWEAVLARLDAVETHLQNSDNRLGGLEKELRAVNRSMHVLHEDVIRVRMEHRDLDERVEKIESQSTR
jgi:predicted nuclease with TOPRIM domain